MRVLLVSTYELGHQPLHLASATAVLEAAGHDVRCVDLSVEGWEPQRLDGVDAVGFAVPMHTAMRIAVKGAASVRALRPELPICFYGLYATLGSEHTLGRLADRCIAGEYETALVAWVDALAGAEPATGADVDLSRQRHPLPVREGLPDLDRYAHLALGGEERVVGYVEASRGCAHRCRHCPVPVVYDGRTRKVPLDVVVADVEQLVAKGARHITFGDPDFLNRPAHAVRVVESVHAAYPDLTYDVTAKVEHLLRYTDEVGVLARTGCLFAVSAFECVNDEILHLLDKGHTAAEASRAVRLLRDHGIEPRPSWLPFTPWTRVEDVADILAFVIAHDLIGNVDPVQYSIRLLIPEGSLLLGVPELATYLGPYDAESLSYSWRGDAVAEALQRRIVQIVEEGTGQERSVTSLFCDVRDAVLSAAGEPVHAADREAILVGSTQGRPRLTEPWFC